MTERAQQIIEIMQTWPDYPDCPLHILCIPRPDNVPGNHPVMLSMRVETQDDPMGSAAMMLGEIVDGYRLAGIDTDELLKAVRKYVESKSTR